MEALVGEGKELTIAFRKWRWQVAACSLLGEEAACKWENKNEEFSQTLPPCQVPEWVIRLTVGFQCRTQLLSTFGRYWLCCDSTGKVFQLSDTVQAAHGYFHPGKHGSVGISHLQ